MLPFRHLEHRESCETRKVVRESWFPVVEVQIVHGSLLYDTNGEEKLFSEGKEEVRRRSI